MYQSFKVYFTRISWELCQLIYCKTLVHSCRQQIYQRSYASSVVNIIFSIQTFNLLINCWYIFFGKDHVRRKCCLIKLFAYLHSGSIQVFSNNWGSISSLIHRNLMVFQLRNSYWHEPMCIYQEVHMEYLPQSINKPFFKIFIFIPMIVSIGLQMKILENGLLIFWGRYSMWTSWDMHIGSRQ